MAVAGNEVETIRGYLNDNKIPTASRLRYNRVTFWENKAIKKNNIQDDTENIKKVIKEFLKLEEPTPKFMKVIINRIELHQDKQVDIIFNCRKLNNIKKCRKSVKFKLKTNGIL